MVATAAIRSMIKENKIAQMLSAIEMGEFVGMQTRDQALQKLLQQGLVSHEEVVKNAHQVERFS